MRFSFEFLAKISVNAEKNDGGRRFVCWRLLSLTHPLGSVGLTNRGGQHV